MMHGWQRLMRLAEVFVFLESFKAEGATHHGDDARDAGKKDDEEYGDDAGGQRHALPNLAATLTTHPLSSRRSQVPCFSVEKNNKLTTPLIRTCTPTPEKKRASPNEKREAPRL